jgi:parallel beta-helix repeat protein
LYFFTDRSFIVLDGLVLDGATNVNGATGLKITDAAHHIRFLNGEIKNAAGPGVFTSQKGGNEFINCHVHDNGARSAAGKSGFDHGFYIADQTMPDQPGARNVGRIESCLIENHVHGFGIHVYGGGTYGYVIKSNVIRNSTWAGILLSDAFNTTVVNNIIYNNLHGIEMRDNGQMVANNTIYGNKPSVFSAAGIAVKSEEKTASRGWWLPWLAKPTGHAPSRVVNNIIHSNNVGIRFEPGASGVTVKKNLMGGHASGNFVNPQTNTIQDNLLNADPKFVNSRGGDFRLQAGSAAINAGVAVNGVNTDFAGVSRPQGSAFDIGAFEFVNGPMRPAVAGRPIAPVRTGN